MTSKDECSKYCRNFDEKFVSSDVVKFLSIYERYNTSKLNGEIRDELDKCIPENKLIDLGVNLSSLNVIETISELYFEYFTDLIMTKYNDIDHEEIAKKLGVDFEKMSEMDMSQYMQSLMNL